MVAILEQAGAPPLVAREIVGRLTDAGLAAPQIQAWLAHPERGVSIETGKLVIDGEEFPRRQTAIFAVEDGHAGLVLEEARRFASASRDERAIALCLGTEMARVHALTGNDRDRAATIVQVLAALRQRLGKDVHVADLVQTEVPAWNRDRIVDRFMAGRQREVLDAVMRDAIDVASLHRDGMIALGW